MLISKIPYTEVKNMKWYFFPFYFIHDLWLILRNRIHYYFHLEPSKKWKTGNKGDIILIQGFNGRWVSLETIGSALHKLGYKVHIVKKLGNNLKSINKGSSDIAEYIKVNDLKNVILIGHSKGAINVISLLKNSEVSERIKKVITIAAPLKSTLLYRFKLLSKELNSKKIVNLYPLIDNMIIPNKNLRWDKVVNRQISVFGHIRVLEAKQTVGEIKSILNSLVIK
jgi:triacylglycerol esterase/lipase EstA (alpha/beta hydrolase family)